MTIEIKFQQVTGNEIVHNLILKTKMNILKSVLDTRKPNVTRKKILIVTISNNNFPLLLNVQKKLTICRCNQQYNNDGQKTWN